eukprot:TRINITY_DN12328_c0_g1_i1.p1 TRINITY_DN12328_c0_g1~~TRINITY_DN12328_c0_g1_i1.p1  ORF type:complete len:223 (-),score=58.50 TRINITY_DN12328_c0_g1_i1:251-919(-)
MTEQLSLAERRRQKILSSGTNRMDFVSGRTSMLCSPAQPVAKTTPSAPDAPASLQDRPSTDADAAVHTDEPLRPPPSQSPSPSHLQPEQRNTTTKSPAAALPVPPSLPVAIPVTSPLVRSVLKLPYRATLALLWLTLLAVAHMQPNVAAVMAALPLVKIVLVANVVSVFIRAILTKEIHADMIWMTGAIVGAVLGFVVDFSFLLVSTVCADKLTEILPRLWT